jgi:hypothetical protein
MTKPPLPMWKLWCSECGEMFDFRDGCLVVKDDDDEIVETVGNCCVVAYLERLNAATNN